MNAKKGQKPNATDLGFVEDSNIYINDHLTPEKKILAAKARQALKDTEYKIWTVGSGKIYASEKGSKDRHVINEEEDIKELVKSLDIN